MEIPPNKDQSLWDKTQNFEERDRMLWIIGECRKWWNRLIIYMTQTMACTGFKSMDQISKQKIYSYCPALSMNTLNRELVSPIRAPQLYYERHFCINWYHENQDGGSLISPGEVKGWVRWHMGSFWREQAQKSGHSVSWNEAVLILTFRF